MFKQILTAGVVALGVLTAPLGWNGGGALASTVADATPVAGLDPIEFSTGFLSSDGAGGFGFTSVPFTGSYSGSGLDFDGVISDESVSVLQGAPFEIPFPIIPTPALAAGAAMDVVSSFDSDLSSFVIQALYTAAFNVVDPGFDTFLVEIVSFTAFDPLTTALPFPIDATASITAVTVAPIPLPASGLLLIAGLGSLAATRRKQRTKK